MAKSATSIPWRSRSRHRFSGSPTPFSTLGRESGSGKVTLGGGTWLQGQGRGSRPWLPSLLYRYRMPKIDHDTTVVEQGCGIRKIFTGSGSYGYFGFVKLYKQGNNLLKNRAFTYFQENFSIFSDNEINIQIAEEIWLIRKNVDVWNRFLGSASKVRIRPKMDRIHNPTCMFCGRCKYLPTISKNCIDTSFGTYRVDWNSRGKIFRFSSIES